MPWGTLPPRTGSLAGSGSLRLFTPLEEVLSHYFQTHEHTSLIQRFAQVDEIADAAIFLAKNGAVNGSSLRVEGGIIRAL